MLEVTREQIRSAIGFEMWSPASKFRNYTTAGDSVLVAFEFSFPGTFLGFGGRELNELVLEVKQSLFNPNSPNESVTPISDPQGSGDGHGRSAYPGDPRQPTNGSSLPKASPATDHTWANRHGSFEDPFQA